jgi:hopanoid biosynthesis associated RND transporter like protein HpnN
LKKLSDQNIVALSLGWMARAVLRHGKPLLYCQLLLAALCVVYTVKNLKFNTRRDNLVGSNKRYHQNFKNLKKEFPNQDDLVVVVEGDDGEKMRQFVERLGAKLEAETNLFRDVFYKGDLKMLGSKALLFLEEEDLVELKRRLGEYRPFLKQFTSANDLVSLFNMVNRQFRTAKAEENAENQAMVKSLPALERIIRQATDSLKRTGTPPSPGVTALFNPGQQANNRSYITFGGGRIYIVTAQAEREQKNADAVERMRTLAEETRTEVPGLNVGLTGEPVLEHDEMVQSQKDTMVASVVSLIICALIFIYGYQETGRPIKATFCLIVGLAYTMAFSTFTIGHLNILTITFVPILIGLAIDYGVHLISRYEEELRHGKTEEAALTKAMVYTGQGIFTGAFTTAGAFLAMCFTDFKGIQEMGIICGGGLLICLIPMLTMLPALLLKGRQNVIDHIQGDPDARRARIENLWLQRPVAVGVITLALCALAATQAGKVYFDYNLLNMQSAGLPAVEFEKKLIYATNSTPAGTNSAPKSVLYGAVVATNLSQALELEKRLKALPAVAGVDSITGFLAQDQAIKLKLVNEIKELLRDIDFKQPDPRPVDMKDLSSTLYSTYGYLGAAADATHDTEPALSRQLMSMRSAVEALRKEMLVGTDAEVEAHARQLTSFQRALFEDVHDTFVALKTQDTRKPLEVQDLPPSLRNRFVGVTGKFLLMINPKKDLWDRANQKEFIEEIRQVDPQVTGTPVQLYEYTSLLKNSYEEAARYSLVAIIILVLIHFRSIPAVILALIPVGIGSLWLGGFMGYFDVPLNPANIMTLPLVIGIGVTNGIHILNRFAEEQTPSILARSTGKAVLVSGLTTIAGFGSLILGKHRGIESLGYVMSIGLATCMIAGLTFLPALLNLILRWRKPTQTPEPKGAPKKADRPSADNARSTPGREEPR